MNVENDGILSPGLSAGALEFTGDLDLLANAELQIELGGLSQGTEYDFVVAGRILLAGILSLSFIDDFGSLISDTDEFTIVESGLLSGAFANVASGSRITTAEGHSLQVDYGPGSPFGASRVVLSGFEPVPEPSTCLLVMLGLVGTAANRRR